MSADLLQLIPELQPFAQRLVNLAGLAGVQPRVTSTLRGHSLQKRLYDSYVRGESKYPVAPPGQSAHEYGYAFDMVADTVENLHDLGTVWTNWGGVWSPHDEVHFEYPGFSVPTQGRTNVAQAEQPIPCPPWSVFGILGIPCTSLYAAEDFAISVMTPFKTTIAELLIEAGYPNTEVAKILSHPASELHRQFPWIPF